MTATLIPIRRTGLHYFRRLQVFECAGCLEHVPVYRHQAENPERFAEARERAEDEHRACWTFRTAEEARRARRARAAERRKAREIGALGACMVFELAWLTRPINNLCLDCNTEVIPTVDRQELATDAQGQTRRRCGKCIAKRRAA